MSYSTPADVIAATGAKHEDLDLDGDEELTALLQGWLDDITDLINTHLRRDFEAEEDDGGDPVPRGIHANAREMCAEMWGLALQRRRSPVIQVGDFTIRQVRGQLLTKERRMDLENYRRRGLLPIGLHVVTGPDDEDEALL